MQGGDVRRFVHAITVVASLLSLVGAVAGVPAASATTTRRVSVSAAHANVTLGERAVLTVTLSPVAGARTVQIQTLTKDIFGNTSWTRVSAQHVSGVAKHVFKPVVDHADQQRFRAVVSYTTGPSAVSKSLGITVWSWTPLWGFSSYYATNGIFDSRYLTFAMAGNQYVGWYTYGTYGMWEKRYTSGRHCKTFRGDFGVTDSSADGSTGQFDIVSVDTGDTLYTSPALSPGAVVTAKFALPTPYRISIQARNTSPDGLVSYPAIGDPELLCTGLG